MNGLHTYKKVRVLFVLPSYASGGAERVLITLMNELDRSIYEPVILTINDTGELQNLVYLGIRQITLKKKSVLFSLPQLFFAIKQEKPDIVVSTMTHINFSVLALSPFFPKKHFIVREAITPSFLFEKYKWGAFLLKFLYRFLYPKADFVLSPTAKVFDEFRAMRLEGENFIVLPNPVNETQLRGRQGEADKGQNQVVEFVACGRLNYQKGFDRLISALALAEFPFEWHLTILGEGQERERLEALVHKHKLDAKIFLPGLVSNPPVYMASADIFVLPSRWEGLPNVVLESLAVGTPVIAMAEAGGIEEISIPANKAFPSAVKVVNTISEFIAAMARAEPSGHATKKKSLLPEQFQLQNVMTKFEEILNRALS